MKSEWTFSSFFLVTYLSFIFLLDASTANRNWWQQRGKKSIHQVFLKNFTWVWQKNLANLQTQLTLDNSNTEKIELCTKPRRRNSISRILSPVPWEQNLWKFIFDNWNFYCLEQLLCLILIIGLSSLPFCVIENQLQLLLFLNSSLWNAFIFLRNLLMWWWEQCWFCFKMTTRSFPTVEQKARVILTPWNSFKKKLHTAS